MNEMGKFLFLSPKCTISNKIAIYLTFLVFIGFAIGTYLFLHFQLNIVIIILVIFLITAWGISCLELPLHFRVYTNGIAIIDHSLNPLSNCETIKEKKFINNKNIIHFHKFFPNPYYEKEICIVLLSKNSNNNSVDIFRANAEDKNEIVSLERLTEYLQNEKIKEEMEICDYCKPILFHPLPPIP